MLLSVTVAFLLGLMLGSYLPFLPSVILFTLTIAALFLTYLEHRGRLTTRHGLLVYISLLAGVLYWTAVAHLATNSRLLDRAGSDSITIMGTIVESVRHAPGRVVIVLSVSRLAEGRDAEPVDGRLRLTWRKPDRTVEQGDWVELTARIRAPSGTVNPGGFDYAAYLERRRIDAVASVSGPGQLTVLHSATEWSWWTPWRVIDRWRERIRQAAVATLSGSAAGIYLGMIVGESGYLTPEVRDAFMATGTVHILSISGSHLGLIAFLSFFCIKGACRRLPTLWLLALSRRITPTRLAAMATIAPVTFYSLLAGAEVATVRSLVMILIFLLAVWLGNQQNLLLALASAALLILIHDPRALYDISFQLSYLSVLAIALVLRWRVSDDRNGLPGPGARSWGALKWLREYVWITGGVTLATIPLVAYYFNQIAWLGLLANLVVVPLAGFLFVPLGLGSAIWLLLAGGDSLPAGPLNQAVLDLMSGAVGLVARIPGAEWHAASPAIPAMAGFFALLYAAGRSGSATVLRWSCASAALLILVWWSWSPRGLPDGETLRVTFLDVGQGDASVIELPDGRTVLIDGGATYDTLDMGRAVVGPYLWDRSIRRLDHVIGTHPQLDHVGGLAWVIRTFEVGRYWDNGIERDEPFYQRLRAAMQERDLAASIAEEGQMIMSSGPCRLRILNPPAMRHATADRAVGLSAGGMTSGSALNNMSVVTELNCGPHSFLFTADIEAAAQARLSHTGSSLGVRVLKVPHHGARSSLHTRWIRRVGADVAVISVGRHNPYGHPASDVLAAYKGARLLRTDRHGAVWVTAKLSSPDMEIHTAQEHQPEPIHVGSSMLVSERRNLARLWNQWMGP